MKISDICRDLSNNFAKLAEELDKQQEDNQSRIDSLDRQTKENHEALKNVANAILGTFKEVI